MVYSTMLDGIIYGAVWYNICHAKDFGNISQRLSHTNVYTTKRERLYHSPSSQEAHFGVKTTWFTTQNYGTYTSKLP